MLHIGKARHPGLVSGKVRKGVSQLSLPMWVVGLPMGIWHWIPVLSSWPLVPTRAGFMGHQLRKADRQSVWAPAGQDLISGGHAGLGVIGLCGAPLSAPSLVTL